MQPYTTRLLDPSKEMMSFSIPFVRYILTYLLIPTSRLNAPHKEHNQTLENTLTLPQHYLTPVVQNPTTIKKNPSTTERPVASYAHYDRLEKPESNQRPLQPPPDPISRVTPDLPTPATSAKLYINVKNISNTHNNRAPAPSSSTHALKPRRQTNTMKNEQPPSS